MPAPARYATPRTPGRKTYGPAVVSLAALLGWQLMPWQVQVLQVALEVVTDETGAEVWAYPTVVVTVQRQAGKTTLLGPVHLHRGFIRPRGRCWHVDARTRQDARDTWLDIADAVELSPAASRFVVRKSNGSETITGPTRATFRITAPDGDGLHGKANELVDVDEAWAYDAEQGASLLQGALPTFTTTGGQLWVLSTAGTAASVWLLSYVDRGRSAVQAGRTEGLAYFEWSLPDEHVDQVVEGLSPDAEPEQLAAALQLLLDWHPGNGYTLKLAALRQAAGEMTPGDFLRAYGNRWTQVAEQLIPAHRWEAARRESWPAPEGPVALGFAVSIDRSDAAILGAWRDAPGRPLRVDVVDHRPGTAWVADRVVELHRAWRLAGPVAHAGAGPGVDVADAVELAGVPTVGLTAAQYGAACSAFLAAIVDGRIEHPGAAALDDAVAMAAKRDVGDGGWCWSRRMSAGSIAALEAASVAAWAYDHRPRPVGRPEVATARTRPPATAAGHPRRQLQPAGTAARLPVKARAPHPG